jgi:hypothetical protein
VSHTSKAKRGILVAIGLRVTRVRSGKFETRDKREIPSSAIAGN